MNELLGYATSKSTGFSENEIFQEDATTVRTLRNIRNTLTKTLLSKGVIEENNDAKEIVENMLSIHGLSKQNFDFVSSMEKIISGKLNDNSIDDNSNKNEKSISGIATETSAPVIKAIGYDYLYRMMVHLFGKKEAKRLSGEMYDFSLAISDSTKLLVPYCWSFDASKIVLQGRPFGQLPSKPPKRLIAYISALNETVHQMSSHVAGALAVGTFFIDSAHMLLFKEGKSLKNIREDKDLRKYIENCFQSFVHSVNHLSRNGIESPFTNISIFDRPKIKSIISNDNMGWYFDDAFIPSGIDYKEEEFDNFNDYIIEYIIELQRIYTDFFDRGDPMNGGIPYRFPVSTVNFSKKKDENGEYKIIDKKFLEEFVRTEIYRYNIYTSEGTKVASCCRLINDIEMMELAGQSNSFGGTSISLGSHRVVTTNFNKVAMEATSMENFYEILSKRVYDSSLILKAHKELIKKLAAGGLHPFITNGWIDMNKMFSTFGIVAVHEAELTLRNKFDLDKDFDVTKDFLKYFNDEVSNYSKQAGIIGNIEQIPAESMAHRLVKADKLIFGEENIPFTIYSNQFIPLYEDATLWERMEKDGRYNELLTGGGIVHFNLGSTVTESQAKNIISFAVSSGCEHFALNSIYKKCENGHVSMGKSDKCPHCDGEIIEYYTRIIGFMTPVSSWSELRRTFDFPNRKFTSIAEEASYEVEENHKEDIWNDEPKTEKDIMKAIAGIK